MGLACRLPALGLLLRALLVCTQSQEQESVFAIVGEDFTFSPKVNGTIREITWMKRKNKVAEWERDELPIYFSLRERGELETSSGNFTIKKLNTDDAVEYEAQVLPILDDQLQYTKFVLEVLAPPPPSVLNCSVTDGQIRISCAIQFSKDVRYSWYRNDRKIDGNSSVLELEENADPSGEVLCVREVSKTKINDSISLSACFRKSDESISRGRDGLIAVFVIFPLILFMGALFFLWKRAVYKPEEQHLTDDYRFPEESGQKEDPECENSRDFELAVHQSDEATKLVQIEGVPVILHCVNESQTEKEEKKNSEETVSTSQADLSSNPENPDYENISKENQKPEEKKNSEETVSTSQADLSSNPENPDSENISDRNLEIEEKKNSEETVSTSQADLSSNPENPDSENISDRNLEIGMEKNRNVLDPV
ncbi:lymphocyte function-associated antigen 3 isoform X5 [Gopherus flavomarginatus]|uniref:lymphocyte function-associated antigen 3 isoform X5 n=1 Tax=Gopherus flavomarginatus TaxID=286002 RepID=UPI0021CC0AF0|nr:lymphocyte function-associated antigen 3 isoform X5 [Gopherus flavomarginatus]